MTNLPTYIWYLPKNCTFVLLLALQQLSPATQFKTILISRWYKQSDVCFSKIQCIHPEEVLDYTTTKLLSPSLHRKWSFQLRTSSVNVTKSAVSCGCGHIYWRNPQWKTSFFVKCNLLSLSNTSYYSFMT